MKLFKKILLVLFVLSNSLTFGQNYISKSNIALDRGIGMYNLKEYEKAEAYLKKSIKNYPQQKAYYYLALTGLALNDTCEYCHNIKETGDYGYDFELRKLYDSLCFTRKIMNYKTDTASEDIYYTVLITEICTKETSQQIYKKNMKSSAKSTFFVEGYDSTATKDVIYFNKCPDFKHDSSDKIIYTVVEEMPEYPGGDEARIFFLVTHLIYPKFAVEKGIQGTVYVSFIVESDGSLSNITILRGVGGGLDEEAVRVIKLMPKWIPGKCDGTPVRVQFNMPLRFTLD